MEPAYDLQEAMTLSMDGGYPRQGSDGGETSATGAQCASAAETSKDHESSCLVAVEETCLAPAFWQALGVCAALARQETT